MAGGHQPAQRPASATRASARWMGRLDTRELLWGAAPSLRVQSTLPIRQYGAMLPNWRVILSLHLLALPFVCSPADLHARENSGVNQFTAPPIADLLQK